MGIFNLLKLLCNEGVLVKIDDLSTWKKSDMCTIGVDGYNWMYKVVRSCTRTSQDGDVAENELTTKFMSKVNYLRSCGFTPYIVFDGDKLPAKEETSNKKKRLLGEDGDIRETDLCVDPLKVTHKHVFLVIQTLKHNHVKYVVAPYEADPQLAFLLQKEHVDVILTADADLILYGCKKIIFDYNKNYYEYDSSSLERSRLFGEFTKEMVLQACMLSGCDYLIKLPGVGIKEAIRVLNERKRMMECENDYLEVFKDLALFDVEEHKKVEYIKSFTKDMKTYSHQRVYDPSKKTIVCLTPFPEETEEDLQPYIGPLTSPNINVEDIANGSIHPITKDRMEIVNSEVKSINKEELQRNREMERLFKATRILKVLQESMLNTARDNYDTQRRQISTDKKLAEACQEMDHDYNFVGKAGALFLEMSSNKIKEAEKYKVELKEKVIEPLNNLIGDTSRDACDLAMFYLQSRQEGESQDDHAKLENPKYYLETSSQTTEAALLLAEQETSKILVHMSKLEHLHCKKQADILAVILNDETNLESFEV